MVCSRRPISAADPSVQHMGVWGGCCLTGQVGLSDHCCAHPCERDVADVHAAVEHEHDSGGEAPLEGQGQDPGAVRNLRRGLSNQSSSSKTNKLREMRQVQVEGGGGGEAQ